MQSKFTQYAVYTIIFLVLLFCGLSTSAYAATASTSTADASEWIADQAATVPAGDAGSVLLSIGQ